MCKTKLPAFVFLLLIQSCISHSRLFGGRVQSLRLNKAHVVNASGVHGSASHKDMGDLACMRWTGGHCRMASCKAERGPTECRDGLCMCPKGYCANAWGKCIDTPGEWIGSYALKFKNPYVPAKAYIGTEKNERSLFGADRYLAGQSESDPAWRLALTAAGFVRLESLEAPGNILTIHYNRRRRTDLLQQSKVRSSSSLASKLPGPSQIDQMNRTHLSEHDSNRHKISDDDDLWPVLKPFEASTPIDSTFQVRAVENGHELWDPQFKVSLASADPDWYFDDTAADHGVAECSPNGWWGAKCEGRHVIEFQPALPARAVSEKEHIVVQAISDLYWWQTVLLVLCVILVVLSFWGCVFYCIYKRRSA
eukprot:gnl/MRDRNA2_/MRDRNA2_57389_c0_seq1.p1 gnl/MRDRNA2_/MRDRNA2_57389_c0~~gnl/MRDRNA2_/MRDRNA2_57389_c0_seq1.p1  ORF type:complete len:365 (+),score=42.35 gnl/MRDRNA2_/MRDRNA2_57389_c0_seq1:104-1198(+)